MKKFKNKLMTLTPAFWAGILGSLLIILQQADITSWYDLYDWIISILASPTALIGAILGVYGYCKDSVKKERDNGKNISIK